MEKPFLGFFALYDKINFMSILDKIFGTESEREIKKLNPIIPLIREREEQEFSNPKEETAKLKERFNKGESLDDLLPDAFALASQVSKRTTGLHPFDVQLMGGVAIHKGNIVEMRTGEGKTLVAVMPAYLNSLNGKSVHIVTVNDYLARRDAVWMGQIFAELGLTVGVINGENQSFIYDPGHKEVDEERDKHGSFKVVYDFLRECSRKESYACDIVYGTNNEFAFDYLRDNIEYSVDDLRQTNLGFAIVDEVDSILIDEARNPLIISSAVNIPASQYIEFAKFSNTFVEEEDYTKDDKHRSVSLTASGVAKLEKGLNVSNIYIEGGQKVLHYMVNALKAKSMFKKNQQYIVRDNKIVIVDEFTGRLQPGRQWSEGLHQAIEAKEGVPIQQETRTYASITFQNYFRMYGKLSGMTGTALSSQEEFFKVYKTPVIAVPTNNEVKRHDYVDLVYQTSEAKFTAVVGKIQELNKKGQPVLVGTASIDNNEYLAKKLKRKKIPHEVLNAKNHEREGEIIANAGKKGSVTIATNLAGRGVDIKLGGIDAPKEIYEEIKGLGGLFVIGTERNESRRVDNQLRGRSGRQGDEGETQFYISMEDSLVRIFGSDRVRSVAEALKFPPDQPIQNKMIANSIEGSQKRIEGQHFDSRRFSLQYDTVLSTQRSEVYSKRRKVLFGEELSEYVNNFSELKEELGEDKLKGIVLRSIDLAWIEHLELMDYAKGSVNLRSYGQKEPLAEYKRESSKLFNGFWDYVKETVQKNIDSTPKKEE